MSVRTEGMEGVEGKSARDTVLPLGVLLKLVDGELTSICEINRNIDCRFTFHH